MTNCDICTTVPEEIILPSDPKGELLYCSCPFCQQKVGAEMYEGKITCPACGKSVPFSL